MYKWAFLILLFFCLLLFSTCKHGPIISSNSTGFPEGINEIMSLECAISGCHNDKSRNAAGGLSLASWDRLFEGGFGGSAVVPYRADQSYLAMYINTHEDLGVTLKPTMPYNDQPLSREQVKMIMDWINEGAPNAFGFVKFSDNPSRRKIYVTNQGCDLVAVFDQESMQVMRYIDVGINPAAPEAPHMVKVSPDGRYWYVIFSSGGSVIQKFSTADDSFVGQAFLENGSWNTFAITSDGKMAFLVDFSSIGVVSVVDLENMKVVETYSGILTMPHGSALSPDDKNLYVTGQLGNFIYKLNVEDVSSPEDDQISLDGNPPTTISSLDPHEIIFSPDGSRYFVSCQGTNEVRVLNAETDELEAVIEVGGFPQEFSISHSTNYLFVSCMEDSTVAGQRGVISVIDYQSLTEVKRVYSGFQPHGLAVDDEEGLVYVANRNFDPGGPAPHHATECAGRNGYLTVIDMATLEIVPGLKREVSVDPYSVALRP